MDRAYIDFERLYLLNQCGAFFVVRAKRNLVFSRNYSKTADKSNGVLCDQTIVLTGVKTSVLYPEKLRRVKYFDAKTNKLLYI